MEAPANPARSARNRCRTLILNELGFETYRDYLQSALWASIRERVLQGGKHCVGCCSLANQVHHERYTERNLAGKSLEYLLPICHSCHRHIELSNGGTALLSPKKVAKKLRKRIRRNEKRGKKGYCRCCERYKRIGRADICLGCYKLYRERVYEVAERREERLSLANGVTGKDAHRHAECVQQQP